LPGDIAKKRDSGGLFTVPLSGPELDFAITRAAAGAISATGPMFGAKMRWPEGAPHALEREVLDASALGEPGRLEAFARLGEGTRRPLRIEVSELSATAQEDPNAALAPGGQGGRRSIAVRFVLPKGGFATTVLGLALRLVDASARGQTFPEDFDNDKPDE